MNREKSFNIIRTLFSMVAAILVAFIIIVMVSKNPFESIQIFLLKPLTSKRYIGNIIEAAIPLIFSGLSISLLFRTGLFNLGGEGVFYFSGIIGSILAIWLKLPPILLPLACFTASAIAGTAVMLVPGILRAKYNANEMVTSLMMNSIVLGIGSYILNNILRDPSVANLVSYKYNSDALLPVILKGTRVHAGFLIALLCAALVYVYIYKTRSGYEIRVTGTNPKFAQYSGINVTKVIIMVHVLAGAIAGVGGMVECLGLHRRFEWTGLPGYGFDGCMIAMLANNNPFGVVGASLFVGYLRVGADLVNRSADVPTEMIAILQSLIILLISAEKLLKKYRQRWIEKDVKEVNHEVAS
ncbi:ABC transporter permease [Fusibacter ferrireducens]|uniref:ABC transporter permease n=1 Tax=Fusibacter ferrireducens TaxID=2785058 RepID=A0ABR9ZNE0_9FIRM|nr:ABC transporter permease [Fusibacter ferrireducens]MBF4691987.1 ABC transporter permease [Fusibacter ferrireducens]